MLRETGLKGDVVAIDCSEYPCMVQGRLEPSESWQEDWRKLQDAMKKRSDAGWHSCSSSAGRNGESNGLQFVVAHCGDRKADDQGRERIQARVQALQRTW